MAVERVSRPPKLPPEAGDERRTDLMIDWFLENFEDPANTLPYDSEEGGYQWIWGGPYDAGEELSAAFPEASAEELEAVVERLQRDGTVEWTANDSRISDELTTNEHGDDELALYDGSEERDLPPYDDPHRDTVVETVLLPQRNFGWSVHASFIPVRTNQSLSEVIDAANEVGTIGRDDYRFDSLRHLVSTLASGQLMDAEMPLRPREAEQKAWIDSLSTDSDIFVDDGVVVHASPPEWVNLANLFKHGSVGGVALISQSPSNMTGVVLMYGGSLIFLRLVRNVNFLQDAFFERWAKQAKKGKGKRRR